MHSEEHNVDKKEGYYTPLFYFKIVFKVVMKVDVSNILAEQISSVELLNEADKVTLIKTLFQQLCEVKGELSSLKKMIFGSKTEKFVSPLSSTSLLKRNQRF